MNLLSGFFTPSYFLAEFFDHQVLLTKSLLARHGPHERKAYPGPWGDVNLRVEVVPSGDRDGHTLWVHSDGRVTRPAVRNGCEEPLKNQHSNFYIDKQHVKSKLGIEGSHSMWEKVMLFIILFSSTSILLWHSFIEY